MPVFQLSYDFIETELIAGAEISKRALGAAETDRGAGKAGADQIDAVLHQAFGGNDRLVAGGPALAHLLVGDVPVETAKGPELDAVGDLLENLRRQPGEQWISLQHRVQRVAPIILIDVALPTRVEPPQLTQSLPADLQKMGLGLGKNRSRTRHAAERRQFAENLAGGQAYGAVVVENARHVLKKNVGRGAGLAARLGADIPIACNVAHFGLARIRPQLRQRAEEPLLVHRLPAQHIARQARRQHHAHGARENKKRRTAVVTLTADDIARLIRDDACVIAQNPAQRDMRWKRVGTHIGDGRYRHERLDIGVGHV